MKAAIDTVLHPPARLRIAAVLARVSSAEFALLKDVASASDSVLSKHLSALADAGYVRVSKAVRDGRQRTWAAPTRKGRAAFAAHMAALQVLAAAAGLAADAAE